MGGGDGPGWLWGLRWEVNFCILPPSRTNAASATSNTSWTSLAFPGSKVGLIVPKSRRKKEAVRQVGSRVHPVGCSIRGPALGALPRKPCSF